MKEEPVWGNDKSRTALDIRFSEQTGAAPGSTAAQPSRDIPLGQIELPKRDGTNNVLQGLQLMSWDYIKGKWDMICRWKVSRTPGNVNV